MQLIIPSCLGHGPKDFNMHRLKSMFFLPIDVVSNKIVFMSYQTGTYLEKKKKKVDKEKQRIQVNSKNNNKHLWFYLLCKKLYFSQKDSL